MLKYISHHIDLFIDLNVIYSSLSIKKRDNTRIAESNERSHEKS